MEKSRCFGPMGLTERAPLRPIRFHLAECKRFARVYLILYRNARARAEPESRPLSKRVSMRVKHDRVSTIAQDENRHDSDFEFVACDYPHDDFPLPFLPRCRRDPPNEQWRLR